MQKVGALTTKCLLSVFGVLAAFLAFAGISLLAELISGVRLGTAFRHRLLFIVMFSLAQLGIALGDPVNNRFRIWLRVSIVCGLCIFSTWLFSSELVTLRLITLRAHKSIMLIAVLFSVLIGVSLYRTLRKHCARSA